MRKRIFIWALLGVLCQTGMSQANYSLEEALERVKTENDIIKRNNIELAQAKAQVKEFRAIGIPTVNGSIDYNHYLAAPVNPVEDFITPSIFGVLEGTGLLPMGTYTGPPETFEFSFVPRNVLTGGVSARWLIFDGSYLVGLEASKQYAKLVGSQVDKELLELKSNVTKAYLNVLLAGINLNTLSNNLSIIQTSRDEAQQIFEAGFIEQLDVKRLDQSLSNLSIEKQKVEQIEALAMNNLKFLMKIPLDEDIVLTDSVEDLIQELKTDADIAVLELTVEDRPEWKEIELGEALQGLAVKRLKRLYYPSLSAFLSAQESLQRNNLFDNDEIGWNPTVVVGGSLSIPIYDGGMKKAQIQKEQLELEKIALDKQIFKDGLELQFSNAKLQFITAKYSLESAEDNLKLNEEILQTAQIKYNEGVGSSLEVNQAQSGLFQAQATYLNAVYNLINAKSDIDSLLGNL